ncbi:MAG TPA: amidohydrolase family protein [Acidimicrobiales bacterium]|nr:amidohydrolase family protein [Acidimicrobiales bacterium]
MVADDGESWVFEDRRIFVNGLAQAIFPEENRPGPWDELAWSQIPPSCFDPAVRVEAMNVHHELAAVLFPNQVGFCGSLFQNAQDKDLALLCIRAYNDWIIEEWMEAYPGRFVALGLVPLWDGMAAAAEAERVIARGAKGITFSMAPDKVGFASLTDESWTPLFAVLNEAGVPMCTHVGTATAKADPNGGGAVDFQRMIEQAKADDEENGGTLSERLAELPQDVKDALSNGDFSRFMRSITPMDIQLGGAGASLTGAKSGRATIDHWMKSGIFARFPRLRLALSECGIGWIPSALSFADWQERMRRQHLRYTGESARWANFGSDERLPSEIFRAHILGCFVQEPVTRELVETLGEGNIAIETDYPHIATNWPHSLRMAEECFDDDVPEETRYKVMRGNAERFFNFVPAEPPVAV